MFEVKLQDEATKALKPLPMNHIKLIFKKLEELSNYENPLFHNKVTPMVQYEKGSYRYLVGEYRIMFKCDFDKNIIDVKTILHRENAYKIK